MDNEGNKVKEQKMKSSSDFSIEGDDVAKVEKPGKEIGSSQKPSSDFACLDCSTVCKSKDEFNKHIATHDGYRRYKCSYCDERFNYLSYIGRHERSHTGERPFKCEACHESFARQYTLAIHQRLHTGDKPNECKTCGKNFSLLQTLQRHMLTHTGERPFKCEACHESFARQYTLAIHQRLHTGDKSYECKYCGKKFSQPIALKRHISTHTVERPFKCETCSTSFTHPHHLSDHRRIHTGDKPYLCCICRKTFSSREQMLSHKQQNHENKDKAEDTNKSSTDNVTSNNNMEVDDEDGTPTEEPEQRAVKNTEEVGNIEKEVTAVKEECIKVESHLPPKGLVVCPDCRQSFGGVQHLREHRRHSNCSSPQSSSAAVSNLKRVQTSSVVREPKRLILKSDTIEAEHSKDLIEIKEEYIANIIQAVEVPDNSLTSRPPVGNCSIEMTLKQEEKKESPLNDSQIEKSPLPISAAVVNRSIANPKELMVVWTSKLDEDLLVAASINSVQTVLCVKNLQKLQLADRDERILKKSRKVSFYMLNSDGKCSLWTAIFFGDQHPPAELEDQLFRNFKAVEKIFADHAKTKEMTLRNIMRCTDDLFQILAEQLSTQIMAFNYSEGN